jgi:molybdenum cofactor biosynthesis enzyme
MIDKTVHTAAGDIDYALCQIELAVSTLFAVLPEESSRGHKWDAADLAAITISQHTKEVFKAMEQLQPVLSQHGDESVKVDP